MGHDTNQQTGCSTTTIILVVVAGMAVFLLLLMVGLAALFYTRASTALQHERAAREEALMRVEQARQAAMEARARAESLEAKREAEDTFANAISIAQDGTITLNGGPVSVERLLGRLATSKRLGVTIEADPQCPFEHVAEVLAICREAEIEGVQVRMQEDVPPANERGSPAEP
jgi:biopolymer transport protein ExbD